MVEMQGLELVGRSAPAFAALLPMLIGGCLYLAFLVAFMWGFFSMVMSHRRIAAAQEDTAKVLREIAGAIGGRDGIS